MLTAQTLLAFSAATIVLLILPGPAVMYIVTRSATQGRVAGLVSVAGIHLGTTVHIGAAMVGLSAILATSATAFTIVKLVGAAYLMWLGALALIAYWRDREGGPAVHEPEVRSLRRVFADGVILNVLNPKTAIFFLSFVPQFVDPGASNPAAVIGLLGVVFIVLGIVSDGLFALLGGWVGTRLQQSSAARRRKDLVAGTTYLGLGAFTALSGGRSA